MSEVSIIGSGAMAAAIGGLAVKAGHAVEFTGRDAARARALADRVGSGATTVAFGAALAGDLIILAVPYAAALDVVRRYGQALAGRILVDVTNPIRTDLTDFLTSADSFGAREVAEAAPAGASVVEAFNTLPPDVLAAGPVEGRPLDVFLAGDDARSKARVSSFVASLGLRPMDVGRLPMARTLEHARMLRLGLEAHSLKHARFSIGVTLDG